MKIKWLENNARGSEQGNYRKLFNHINGNYITILCMKKVLLLVSVIHC